MTKGNIQSTFTKTSTLASTRLLSPTFPSSPSSSVSSVCFMSKISSISSVPFMSNNNHVKPPKRMMMIPLGTRSIFSQVSVGILCASYWRGMWYLCDDHLFPNSTLHSGAASLAMGSCGLALSQGLMGYLVQNRLKDHPMRTNTANTNTNTNNTTTTTNNTHGNKETKMKSNIKKNINLPRQYTSLARFGSLYCVSTSCVLVWRGAWLLWDCAYEHSYQYIYQRHPANNNQDVDEAIKATDPQHLTYSGVLSHLGATLGLLAMGRFTSVLAPPANVSIMKDITLRQSIRTWREYSNAAKWFFK